MFDCDKIVEKDRIVVAFANYFFYYTCKSVKINKDILKGDLSRQFDENPGANSTERF